MKINMTQQEIKDCLHALDTAESILSNISEQVPKRCPTLKEQSKGGKYHKQFAKIRVGGGQRWWRKTASMMQVLRGQLAPHHTSERHKRVLLKPKLGLGEGFSIEIDKGVAPLVKELWKNKIRTYECCQGGYDGEIGS